MDNKWHFTEEGDYPVVFGEYLNKHYPQIPCLVEYRKTYGIRFWNVTEECWDDEECDDFFCKKDAVARWRYLDALLVQQPSLPAGLEEEMDKFFGIYRDEDGYAYDSETNRRCLDWKDDEEEEHKMLLAHHFYELGLNARKK